MGLNQPPRRFREFPIGKTGRSESFVVDLITTGRYQERPGGACVTEEGDGREAI